MNPYPQSKPDSLAARQPFLCLCVMAMCMVPLWLAAQGPALNQIAGWQQDNLDGALSSWRKSCLVFQKRKLEAWKGVCEKSAQIDPQDTPAVRKFFEQNFSLHPIANDDGSRDGIITGYYQPVLSGSLSPDDRHRFPIYAIPEATSLRTLSRENIANNPGILKPHVIAWTNDPYDLFFLHIQGSGLIRFNDGGYKSLAYAGNNGHDYTSIGKVLVERGEMRRDEVSMQTLKRWLTDHPDQAFELMNENRRFIFFSLNELDADESGPRGSLNVPLTPMRSIAIDPQQVTLGSPVWLDTTLPAEDQSVLFRQLVFAQDTGAAIKGRIRADVFFGRGDRAEFLAGHMNQSGRMYLLTPK